LRPSADLPLRRKAIYRLRRLITRGSHRVFALARALNRPNLYTGWARPTLKLYQALAWGAGPLGKWLDRPVLTRVARSGQCSRRVYQRKVSRECDQWWNQREQKRKQQKLSLSRFGQQDYGCSCKPQQQHGPS
jgi:hypothetical protein